MKSTKDNVMLSTSRKQREGFECIIGESDRMEEVYDQAARVARTDSTVLLTGRTGTGKDLLAQSIHGLSPRRNGPFVAVNVAAVPPSLLESEMFGHVKGAFTDAATSRTGRFEAAHGGTLFIDEIGDLDRKLQAKLLRVLESRVVSPVGANREIHVDVRVVAATSRNIHRMVAGGEFREDLYYRLNVVQIHLPDLCQRDGDIRLLVKEFVNELARRQGRIPPAVDEKLLNLFESYDWPGNVRELKNCLESMMVMNRGPRLTQDDLPDNLLTRQRDRIASLPLAGLRLKDLRRQAIRQTLDRNNGNRLRTAECLGISARTLHRFLQQRIPTGVA